MHSNKDQNEELDQFLDFLSFFCTELSSGVSPEHALFKSVCHFGDYSPEILASAQNAIINGSVSFAEAWSTVVQAYQGTNCFRIVELLGKFLEKGARIGGMRMLKVIQQIRTNITLTKNRKNLVIAQRMKVFGLAIVSSGVLGMIAGLAPFLAFAFSDWDFIYQLQEIPITYSMNIVIALLLTVLVLSYRLTQAVGNSSKIPFLCSLIFMITYVLTSNLLALLP